MDGREEIVSKFTALLGTREPSEGNPGAARSLLSKPESSSAVPAPPCRKLSVYISSKTDDNAVICTIPSLDMQKVEDTGVDLLPKVGEHHFSTGLKDVSGDNQRPHMDASVLGNAADASVLANSADASAKAAQLEQKATQSLGSLTSWTKSSVIYAPSAISANVSNSFSTLVDSRVRAWTLLLLRHSLTTGDSASRSRLLNMLSSIIKVESAHTTFKTLPLPQSAMGQPKESDVILPLLFEVQLKISIESKANAITLRAPGTVSADFVKPETDSFETSPGLSKVDIRLDTGALLESMVQQVRMIVFKAVAKATSISEGPGASKPSSKMKFDFRNKLSLGSQSSAVLSNVDSLPVASDVPPGKHQPLNRLQKARSSALKLNSVLQGGPGKQNGSTPLNKSHKSRSVQWDITTDPQKLKSPVFPSPKRQRVAYTTSQFTSYKSFGRPHGGDFGSAPKNATFGDFGNRPIWGRNGKLANHPQPMQSSEHQTQDLLSGSTARSSKNATFDFQKPSVHSRFGLDIKTAGTKRSGLNRVPSSIPRTATALEGWLMKSTNTGGSKF